MYGTAHEENVCSSLSFHNQVEPGELYKVLSGRLLPEETPRPSVGTKDAPFGYL